MIHDYSNASSQMEQKPHGDTFHTVSLGDAKSPPQRYYIVLSRKIQDSDVI
jgi:hypothetical protein